jgi:hypothetical protein
MHHLARAITQLRFDAPDKNSGIPIGPPHIDEPDPWPILSAG